MQKLGTESETSDHPDIKFDGSRYTCDMNIPVSYYGVLIGQGGSTMKRIESETEVKLKIPQAGAKGPVVLTASTIRAIQAAKDRIEVLMESAKKRFKATHFVSIPLIMDVVKMNFNEFCDDIVKDYGFNRKIFQNPDRLHLTICLLLLNDANEIREACDELKKCQEEIIAPLLQGKPLNVHMEGLEYMNDDPSCVNVLYGELKPSDGSDKLQSLADSIVERFKKRGLLHSGQGPSSVAEKVKIHATLMNSIFAQTPDDVSVSSQQRRAPDRRTAFNASKVLTAYGSFDFGTFDLEEIHISKRGEYSVENGYYKPECIISLPH